MAVKGNDMAKTQPEYLANPGACPQCDSDDIEGGFVEVESRQAWQHVHCHQCGARWTDVFNLRGYENLETE